MGKLEIRGRIEAIQTTALPQSARLLKTVLEELRRLVVTQNLECKTHSSCNNNNNNNSKKKKKKKKKMK